MSPGLFCISCRHLYMSPARFAANLRLPGRPADDAPPGGWSTARFVGGPQAAQDSTIYPDHVHIISISTLSMIINASDAVCFYTCSLLVADLR